MKKLLTLITLTAIAIGSPIASLNLQNNKSSTKTLLNVKDNNIFLNAPAFALSQIKGISGTITDVQKLCFNEFIITTTDGLYEYNYSYNMLQKFFAINNVKQVAIDNIDGRVEAWIIADNNLFFSYLGDVIPIKVQDINNVNLIQIDKFGNCWASTNTEIYKINGGSGRKITVQKANLDLSSGDVINKFAFSSQGNVFVNEAIGNNIFYIKNSNLQIKNINILPSWAVLNISYNKQLMKQNN